MVQRSNTNASPLDFVRVFFRHKKKAFALLFFSAVGTIAAVLFWPRSYESEVKFLIRVGRESVTLDPTATVGQTQTIQRSHESDINSALDILGSHVFAEEVAAELGPERVLNPLSKQPNPLIATILSLKDRLSSLLDAFNSTPAGDEGDAGVPNLEEAVRKLKSERVVSAPKNSNVITLSVCAQTPKLAQEIATSFTDVFLREHVRMNRTPGSFDFFAEQADRLMAELTAARRELRDKKNEYGLATVEGKRSILEMSQRDIDLEMLRTERELLASESKLRILTDVVGTLPAEIVVRTESGFSNEARDGMREALYNLQIREGELRQRYQPDHSVVVAIQRQRAELEKIIEEQADERSHKAEGLNPTYQALDLERKNAEMEVDVNGARRQLLAQQKAEAGEALRMLNSQEMEVVQLERRIGLLEEQYRTHAERLENARINNALETQRISNVNVVQPATFVTKPVSPKKKLLLVLGALGGVFGSFGIALVAEYLDQTLTSPEQVEANLQVPVLMTLPHDDDASEAKLAGRRS